MKNTRWLMTVAFLVGLLMPATARAQSPFDGTWKVDLKTAKFPEKPDVYLLQDGMYHCKTCVPSVDVKADGQDHEVSGHPYYDMVSIKVADDRTIEETDKKNGKNGGDFKDMGIGGREYLDVRVYGQLRHERRSRDRQRRGDASGQRSRWIPCDFGLMADVEDGYSVRQRNLDYLQGFWR